MLLRGRFLVLVWLIALGSSLNMFNLRKISNRTAARCLDGSQYGFYIYDPDQTLTKKDTIQHSSNLLIYFQETPLGWCLKQDVSSSVEQCHKWATDDSGSMMDYASSKNWAGSQTFLTGILSPFDAGIFNNWTKVLIKSCDGGSYMGNREPITFKHQKLYFRGGQNIQEAFKYLQSHKYLQSYDNIILTGSFNGAIAVLHWKDYLASLTKIPIKIIADAPVFLNSLNYVKNQTVIENRMKMIYKIVLVGQSLPNKDCLNQFPNEQWKCLFLQNLYPYLGSNIPIFYIQSLYDGWEIREVLGFTCAEDFASLSECTKEHKIIIDQYYKNVSTLLKKVSRPDGQQLTLKIGRSNGAYGIACVGHKFVTDKWNYELFEVPMNSNNTVAVSFSRWFKSQSTAVIYIDEGEWPANKPCSRKVTTLIAE